LLWFVRWTRNPFKDGHRPKFSGQSLKWGVTPVNLGIGAMIQGNRLDRLCQPLLLIFNLLV
jgi:hypothetical protein